MSPIVQEKSSAADCPVGDPDRQDPQAERPRPLLRVVYPLNPGIPHFMDFPQGRK